MQTDFHHAVTYVTARIAGFDHEHAGIIAYAAQYVDDSVSEGFVHFNNGAMYKRISSAHRTIDLGNLKNDENHLVWLPFHFLPGNGGKAAGENPDGTFIRKIVCSPDSPPARDMVQLALQDKNKQHGLHRLGITLHVYVDTWAHQGFAGVLHEINEVEDAQEIGGAKSFKKALDEFLGDVLDETIPPLGHGRARTLPDLPYLKWQYKNGRGDLVTRDNPADFVTAADVMCKVMQQYLGKADSGLPDADKALLSSIFLGLPYEDEKKRHAAWLKIIKNGYKGKTFSFGSEKAPVVYAAEGPGSWKQAALGSSWDLREHQYNDTFLTSHWKLFHDALQQHRLTVLHEILPRYGICAG